MNIPLTKNMLDNATRLGAMRAEAEIWEYHDADQPPIPVDDVWDETDQGELLLQVTGHKNLDQENAEAWEVYDAFENGYYDRYYEETGSY